MKWKFAVVLFLIATGTCTPPPGPPKIDSIVVSVPYKFVLLSHNTIRGAAGGAILNAELFLHRTGARS